MSAGHPALWYCSGVKRLASVNIHAAAATVLSPALSLVEGGVRVRYRGGVWRVSRSRAVEEESTSLGHASEGTHSVIHSEEKDCIRHPFEF